MSYRLNGFVSIDDLVHHYSSESTDGLRVDLGCGFYKPAGFIGIDNLIGHGSQIPDAGNMPDVLMDLSRDTIPLPDHSCAEIRASHFLEHSNIPHVLDEVHRLLQPHGIFLFTVPYANSAEGLYPGHLIFLTEKWFHENIQFQRLFTIEREEYKKADIYDTLPPLITDMPFDIARQIFFNVCKEMTMWCKPKSS